MRLRLKVTGAIHGGLKKLMRRYFLLILAVLFACAFAPATVKADGEDTGPMALTKFVDGAQSQPGLFTVLRKSGKVYLQLHKDQLDADFVQSAVPVNGLGGFGLYPGAFDYAPARLIRFSRLDDKVFITWPNTNFLAQPNTPAENAVQATTAASNVGVAKVVAEDATTGDIVIDADAFLGDVIDLNDSLKATLGTTPENSYHLDTDTASFGPTKAFPQNVLLEVRQNWVTDTPDVVDNVPDPRSLAIRIDYNLVALPNDDYMPRLGDDRVGFFDTPFLDFSGDHVDTRQTHYIIRWNFKPQDPTRPSKATNPMVFYLSNTIPLEYRAALRDGVMEWNNAFARVGILDAVQVLDQPNDPNWDPDDIRYNVLRWLTESNGGGFAEAQLMVDPRTGEEFHTGVLFDADLMLGNHLGWRDFVDPTHPSGARNSFTREESEYGAGMRMEAAYGRVALSMLGRTARYGQSQFDYDFLKSIALHESGHDMGLQHNFIGSEAYTAKELQSVAFTSRYGVATSVMEYSPLNLWPNGTPQGEYYQKVLGPYDYYAIHYGYGHIDATTPQGELPTLRTWANKWANPMYRFASDEDVSWGDAHAVDPRVNHFDLSNDTLGWVDGQLSLAHSLLTTLDHRFPRTDQPFQSARDSFGDVLGLYTYDATMATHFIGGEYLSRSHAGDPGASAPLSAVPIAEERRAWAQLDRYVFSDAAWRFSPHTLNSLTYSEWSPFSNALWAYDPGPRHDIPVIEIAGALQNQVLGQMFQPAMLQRLEALPSKAAPGQTMNTADLFDWAQRSVFGDLVGTSVGPLPAVRRNLQASYTGLLIHLAIAPAAGTPAGAQALARAKLVELGSTLRGVRAASSMDEESRAHLALLQTRVSQALNAQVVVPAK
jgi:hypothetical protein